MRSILLTIFAIALLNGNTQAQTVSLAGQWQFALDRQDVGITEKWFANSLSDKIRLPGSLPAQGIGDDPSTNTPWVASQYKNPDWFTQPQYAKYAKPANFKMPFWLTPDKYYSGVAWYQREVIIPAHWRGKRVVLFLERPHWETRVWVDSTLMGTNDSLATPHEYDLGQLAPGKHTLSIRVDNRIVIDIGENSHAISDHTQGNWNGIVGRLELRATPLVWIEDAQVYPDITNKTARVAVRIGNAAGQAGQGGLKVIPDLPDLGMRFEPVRWETNGGTAEITVPLGAQAKLWDEFHPELQNYVVLLSANDKDGQEAIVDSRFITFGLRNITTQGTQFLINGRKTFIRGTLECCIFPRTGHPPTEVAEWKRILGVARAHGLNLLRFHSYCPPAAAFEAGDEMGFYFQVETCWANQSTSLGDRQPLDDWVYRETARILKAYGNHPSFMLMPYGNEPGGKNASNFLAQYVAHFKALDPRRLWTSGSGWPQLPENQFHVTPDPRVQLWGAGLKSRINSKPPETTTDYHDYIQRRDVPVISHEIGQWCVYPNFAEMPKYTGYLKPRNFEIFRDTLESHGMGRLARKFLLASGKLQTLCYKEDIESALRTSGMGGFELLDLHDFPGQGTALVGVLDPFWEDKGYVTAKEYSRFCNHTVPLARLSKRVFTTDEKLTAEFEVAHFGPEPVRNAVTSWKLVANKVLAHGQLPALDIPIGNDTRLGEVTVDLAGVPAPAHCHLVVSVAGFENDWDVWVYPKDTAAQTTGDVLVTTTLDAAARARLREGGKVLLTIPGKSVHNYETDPVKLGFSSIFWNTAWTQRQAPTTLGLLCDPKHPALARFPTDDHSDWQWWYLVHRAGALRLDLLPGQVEPIVRVIDDWVTARPLALMFEAAIGQGKMIVCGFDLTQGADDPVSRQMRTSLLQYMRSNKFRPRNEFTTAQIEALTVSDQRAGLRDVASIRADSEQEGYEAANAIDGDPETMWHTSWDGAAPDFPHELVIELQSPRLLAGFTTLPRQDGQRNGWIRDYRLYLSQDGSNWGAPAAQGQFPKDAAVKTVFFFPPAEAKFIKLVAVSGYAAGPWASLAEFNLLDAK